MCDKDFSSAPFKLSIIRESNANRINVRIHISRMIINERRVWCSFAKCVSSFICAASPHIISWLTSMWLTSLYLYGHEQDTWYGWI